MKKVLSLIIVLLGLTSCDVGFHGLRQQVHVKVVDTKTGVEIEDDVDCVIFNPAGNRYHIRKNPGYINLGGSFGYKLNIECKAPNYRQIDIKAGATFYSDVELKKDNFVINGVSYALSSFLNHFTVIMEKLND